MKINFKKKMYNLNIPTHLLIAIVLVAMGIVGCTKSKNDKVTLKFLSAFATQKPEGDIERKIIAEYLKDKPNVTIETIGISMNALATQVVTRATGNDLPDIIFANMDMAPNFNDLGILEQDLKGLVGKDFLSSFSDVALGVASIDNKLMYLPLYSNPIAVIYRKDWFDAKGLSEPKTLEEFISVAKALTEDTDGDGKDDRWGIAYIATKNSSGAYRALPIMQSFGAYPLVQEDGKWKTLLGGKESKGALEFIRKFIVEDRSVPPGVLETGYPEAVNFFVSGKAGMLFSGSASYGTLFDQNPELRDKLGSFAWPYDKGFPAVELGVTGYGIAATSEHKEEAADFLKFYYNYKNMLDFAEKTGRMPTRTDVNKSDSFSGPLYEGFIEAADNSISPPLFPGKNEMRDVIMEALHAVVGSSKSIEDINKTLRERAEGVVNE